MSGLWSTNYSLIVIEYHNTIVEAVMHKWLLTELVDLIFPTDNVIQSKLKDVFGDMRVRTPVLQHAKQTLYH